MRLCVDKAGRVVLPKPLRDRFRLSPGSYLDVDVHEDHLRLIPVSHGPTLVKHGGWWVHQGVPDPGTDLVAALHRHRSERLEDLES